MRASKMAIRTRIEPPKETGQVATSLTFMLKAGLIQQHAPGIFTAMPILLRVIHKIEQIVRDEMDRQGGLEISMPILQPKELWEETNRWESYTKTGTMFKVTDRRNCIFGLAPTAEEVVTDIARGLITSYKDLPLRLYQIGPKFRDEIRPRSGVIRSREFGMKDLYSFDRDQDGLDESYRDMEEAYRRVCIRCGFSNFLEVEADSGPIGGSGSAEFMVVVPDGDDLLLRCPKCNYGANVEKAEAKLEMPVGGDEEMNPIHKEATPNIRSVEELEKFFKMPAKRMVETIIYSAKYPTYSETIAVMMRADNRINEVKLKNVLGAETLELADIDTVLEATGCEVGFAGPINIPKVDRIIADSTVRGMRNFLCGCNEPHVHMLDVNTGRDFPEPEYFDVREAKAGNNCLRCDGKLEEIRGIEIGHVFKLRTKYSKAMGCEFIDENGKSQPCIMGCYGIGTTRIAAAIIEEHHDECGIIWPTLVAPYQVVVIPASQSNFDDAMMVYESIQANQVEVIFDDREKSFGHKAKDADLLGIPWKIIVGRKAAQGIVELKDRKTGEITELKVENIGHQIAAMLLTQFYEIEKKLGK